MIGLGYWRLAFGGGIMMYILLMAAVTAGMSHGLQAESLNEAKITPDEYDVEASNQDREYNHPLIPESLEPENSEPNENVQQFVEKTIHTVMSIASAVSVWAYNNQDWISPWWAGKLLQGATYGGVLVYFAFMLRRIRDLSVEVLS